MSRPIATVAEVDDETLERFRARRHDVVQESEPVEEHADGTTTLVYGIEEGPFTHYERRLEVEPSADGAHTVRQVVDCRLGVGAWWVLFAPPLRRVLRRPGGSSPWWAPPDVLDSQAAASLGSLAYLSLIGGYLGTLITQSLTYAADEFSATDAQQANTLAVIRIGVLLSLLIANWADKHGRRRALLACAVGGVVMTGLGALSPGLVALGGTQIVARGLATALGLLIVVVVAEEMPAGSRAYGVSLLTMSGALGAGMVLWLLPLVEIDEQAWRGLYIVPLLFLFLIGPTAKLLPESRRFARRHPDAHFGGHYRRLLLLAGTTLALAVLSTPASQLQNEFLRDKFDFSATQITLFTVLTVTPASIGIVVGGRLADRRGKRLVGGIGLGVGAVLTAGQYVTDVPAILWGSAAVGSVFGGLAVPAMAVYGPELFPTSLRTRANVVITIMGVSGSVIGLLISGQLSKQWELGPSIAVLAVAPVLAVLLLIPQYPETAHKELEELNPEDAVDSVGSASVVPPV
ncbi:MAG: MFS transporter [Acidimicrobiales bacterium]|nr:MFS transporter [Acidimicrobiales bacterium]